MYTRSSEKKTSPLTTTADNGMSEKEIEANAELNDEQTYENTVILGMYACGNATFTLS